MHECLDIFKDRLNFGGSKVKRETEKKYEYNQWVFFKL